MNIFDLLKTDHEKVEKVLEQLQETSNRATGKREKLLQTLSSNLLPHMYAEEQSTVFKIARKMIDEDRSDSVAKRFKEMKKEAPTVMA